MRKPVCREQPAVRQGNRRELPVDLGAEKPIYFLVVRQGRGDLPRLHSAHSLDPAHLVLGEGLQRGGPVLESLSLHEDMFPRGDSPRYSIAHAPATLATSVESGTFDEPHG